MIKLHFCILNAVLCILLSINIATCELRNFLPKEYSQTFINSNQNPYIKHNREAVIVSPDSVYKIVKVFKQSASAFTSGATVIGLYKRNRLIDEKFYNESFYDVELVWESNTNLAMYKFARLEEDYIRYRNYFTKKEDREIGDKISITPYITSNYELIKMIYGLNSRVDISPKTVEFLGSYIDKGNLISQFYIPQVKDSLKITLLRDWKCILQKNTVVVYEGDIKFPPPFKISRELLTL